jgi:hypothetical protein
MDLIHQTKLSKTEWESIEIPVSEEEKKTLQVIINGFENIDIQYNENMSLLQLLKITEINEMEYHIYFYNEYFENIIKEMMSSSSSSKKTKNVIDNSNKKKKINDIQQIYENWKTENNFKKNNQLKIKKADMIRIQHLSKTITSQKTIIVEFAMLEFCEKMLNFFIEGDSMYGFYLFTLIQLQKSVIPYINIHVKSIIHKIITKILDHTNLIDIFHHSPKFIEKNPNLLKYENTTLYSHQKHLFSLLKNTLSTESKLILYTAPTGTGKTISPIGLSTKYKVIFVCMARHVGLALAKSSITMGKKVAFAFGCETASDIRLHYFAAINYIVNKKSGGIQKVDNSIGNNVEIMICDVKSYLTAMHYMLAFHEEKSIITYWDEPTISMDCNNHPLHETIHLNWKENRISKMVLSSATLPNEMELIDVIMDFRAKFENAEIHTVTSYDCKKTISLLNKDMKCCLPHLLFSDYDELLISVNHCLDNKTLMRYFDLEEIVRCVEYINSMNFIIEPYDLVSYFNNNIYEINMNSIKIYYLEMLKQISKSKWIYIYEYLTSTQNCKFEGNSSSLKKMKSLDERQQQPPPDEKIIRLNSVNSSNVINNNNSPINGLLLTTIDAHTLTDGPTIFLVENVEKIAKFLIQQAKIPDAILEDIIKKINENEIHHKKIGIIQKQIEDMLGKDKDKEKKMEKEITNKDVNRLMMELENLQHQIKQIHIEPKYIPNTRPHQILWVLLNETTIIENAFVPSIDESTIKKIMSLNVENYMKLLLLLGIGMFVNDSLNYDYIHYNEIMKKMAIEQRLYIIIAQTDYVYGTNYQFCHGFIGKDLTNMTQQKTIQAMGRIGRNKMQQEYTLRFRNDEIIQKLFMPSNENTEAINMCKLLCSF